MISASLIRARNLCINRIVRKFASHKKPLPLFGGDTSAIYARLAKQHAHPAGPWLMILNTVEEELKRTNKTTYPFKVLDLASGPGEPGITIAKQYPMANVTITDISESQIEIASANSKQIINAHCMLADAEDLSQFADNSFDIVTSCYGYMFCNDLPRAFSEALRVLKPGGSLIMTFWLQLPMMDLQHTMMEAALGAPPPPPAINPLTLSSPGLVSSQLYKANFEEVSTSISEYPFELGIADDDVFAVATIPIRQAIQDMAESGKQERIDIGKKAFWQMLDTSAYYSVRPDGMRVINGNVFEMAVGRKRL